MADELGPALRELRNQAGLTQEELADAAKVGVRTVRRLEAGKGAQTRTLRMVSDALADALRQDRKDVWRGLVAGFDGDTRSQDSEESLGAPSTPDPEPPRTDVSPTLLPALGNRRPTDAGVLGSAAESLARSVRDRWTREEEQRLIHDPKPLPVRWHAVPEGLDDFAAGSPDSKEDPETLLAPVSSGSLPEIATAYRALSSGRLVVLGRAGSGKSVLALRFVLDYLDTRGPDEPVPVVFSLGSWDPTAVNLRDWLVHRLLRDHPELTATAPPPSRSTLAAALLAAGWILPVLDGFDEIAPDLQREAFEALSATTLPFLLTNRTTPADEAATTQGLSRAAAIQLDDLTLDDLADYLPDTANPGGDRSARIARTTAWNDVLATLAREPGRPECVRLLEVLRTPLMVLLARTVYGSTPDEDPRDLLDAERFPTADALEQHLLAGFVPALYRYSLKPSVAAGDGRSGRRPYRSLSPEQAGHYAAQIAIHLRRSEDQVDQDLAWWRLCDMVRPASRVLAVVIAGTAMMAVAHIVVRLPLGLLHSSIGVQEPNAFFADTLLGGPAVGSAFGLVYALTVLSGRSPLTPSRMRVRSSLRARDTTGSLRRRAAVWSAYGFLGGTAMGCAYGVALTAGVLLFSRDEVRNVSVSVLVSTVLVNCAVFSVIFALAASVSFGFVAALSVPDNLGSAPTPLTLLAANRAAAIRQLLWLIPLLALAIGFGGELVVVTLQGRLGRLNYPFDFAFAIASIGGIVGVTTYTLTFTAWGQWLLLARIWLPLTGRLPWSTAEFLDDAYRRGLLRQSGAVYQFRHVRLQAQLEVVGGVAGTNPAPLSPGTRAAASPSHRDAQASHAARRPGPRRARRR